MTARVSRGDWMQTYTGRRFYPLDPRPDEIDPEDIAHALSLLCRYGGHVDRFYSVAEHCVLMSEPWYLGVEPLPVDVEGWPPAVAESRYLDRLAELLEEATDA